MTYAQINRLFSEYSSASWHDPQHYEARSAFVQAMRGRQYGYEALRDAWEWFLVGWNEQDNVPNARPGVRK